MRSIRVSDIVIARQPITADTAPALRDLFGLEELPLAPTRASLTLSDCPLCVVNALRRVLLGELPGHALRMPGNQQLFDDPYMLFQFVQGRVQGLGLPYALPAGADALVLRLSVSNQEGQVARTVYAGDLEVVKGAMLRPLFNPTTELAVIQPGRSITVEDIVIERGVGTMDANFTVACDACYTHLDIPQHSDEEMRSAGGVAAAASGYKVSCLVANPRRHRLTFTLPATADAAEAYSAISDACVNVKDRLRRIAAAVEPGGGGGMQYSIVRLANGLHEAVLHVPDETYTIGEILRRYIFDSSDTDVANVGYTIPRHERRLTLKVSHAKADVTAVVLHAIRQAIAAFDDIQSGIADAAH
jgi:DNA-directed RNA polymerase subunit L